ncbi:MAG: nicotinamide-nucleotide adenylyltransferase [Thermoplasmata archaeon]
MTGTRALFIGRFQPFHRGHLYMLRQILEDFGEVFLGIGSSQFSHTLQNPFTSAERYEMIQRTLEDEGLEGCRIVPIPDVGAHSQWVSHVLSLVPPFEAVFSHDPLTRQLFQEAGITVLEKPLLDRGTFSGTEIRRRILEGGNWKELVPPPVADFIEEIDGVARVRAISDQ